jgi:acyl-CoA synthetase (AMP-forming)/AMP-acid ligase II
MGDDFESGPDPAGDALTAANGEPATMAELLARSAVLADRVGLGDADRLLSGRPLLTADGAAAGLLAPLLCGAGVVRVADLDPARFWKRVADERVTVAVLDPEQAAAVHRAGPGDPSNLRMLLDD